MSRAPHAARLFWLAPLKSLCCACLSWGLCPHRNEGQRPITPALRAHVPDRLPLRHCSSVLIFRSLDRLLASSAAAAMGLQPPAASEAEILLLRTVTFHFRRAVRPSLSCMNMARQGTSGVVRLPLLQVLAEVDITSCAALLLRSTSTRGMPRPAYSLGSSWSNIIDRAVVLESTRIAELAVAASVDNWPIVQQMPSIFGVPKHQS